MSVHGVGFVGCAVRVCDTAMPSASKEMCVEGTAVVDSDCRAWRAVQLGRQLAGGLTGPGLQALVEYWESLPEEHRGALFRLREEDFVAELDAHLKYQLRICRDCRGNVRAPAKRMR